MDSKCKPWGEVRSTSSAQALTELATHVTELLEGESLDPRFARKLLKRIANEAETSSDEMLDDAMLGTALKRLRHAVNAVQAGELVAAAAELRTAHGHRQDEDAGEKKNRGNKRQ
jgi:hypothetical protein